jgi:AcrR family transcriptional regulator
MFAMATRKADADSIIAQAEGLLRRQGYGNTSMGAIGANSGLQKGSIYHYFASKEDLGAAILERIHEDFRELILSVAYQDQQPARSRLKRMMKLTLEYFADKEGCLVAHLGLETAQTNARFRKLVDRFFDEWTRAIAYLLSGSYGQARATRLAEELVAKIEGGAVWLKVRGDVRPLKKICKESEQLL